MRKQGRLTMTLLVTDTSRAKKSGEIDGEEYFFVTRQDMEKDIQNKKYV